MESLLINDTDLIAFASDTQAPMLVETILLKPTKNRTATRLLFTDILRRKPATLFLLGDVVNLGSSDRQWKPIDEYLDTLRNRSISVHAILGNHEVMGRSRSGVQKFQTRFPNHKHTGYLEIVNNVAVVLVNSNFNSMTREEDRKQEKWYHSILEGLDTDATIQHVIIGCHHSPYTNSRIVAPSTAVQKRFVQPFLQSKKSHLFLSGHSHNFEHYKVEGKDFLVIGGGGGLRQPLRQGIGALADLAPDYKPMFHYITVRPTTDHLLVTTHHLKPDFTGFEDGKVLQVKKAQTVHTDIYK